MQEAVPSGKREPIASPTDVALRKDLWLRAYRIRVYKEIEWSDVTLEDPETGKVLRAATGRACPGQIVSIWGPNDSGIDLLAEILAGTIEGYSGNVESAFSNTTFAGDVDQSGSIFPETQTMREVLEFYFRAVFPGSVIPSSETSIEVGDVIREFDLAQIQFKRCDSLSRTEKQLLYAISMILRPQAILILHNLNRHLTNRQCKLIANRLRLLADTGHTIVFISSFTSSTFLELSDYVHVYHMGGKEYFAGSPKNLENYLQRNDVVSIVNRYSHEDLLYCAFSIDEKDFSRLVPRVEDPPKRSSLYSDSSSGEQTASSWLVFLVLRRSISVLLRHDLLLRAKILCVLSFAAFCRAFHSRRPADNITAIVDLFLAYTAGMGLIFATMESSTIDSVLIQEGKGPLKGICSGAAVIGTRVILIVLCESLLTFFLCSLFSSWVEFPIPKDLPTFASTTIMCSLFYTFFGSFSGLFVKQQFRTMIHVMILFFIISAMVTLGSANESDSLIRLTNPVFIARSIIISHSSNIPGVTIKNNLVYGPKNRVLGRKVGFWGKFALLSAATLIMAALYVVRFLQKLRGRSGVS